MICRVVCWVRFTIGAQIGLQFYDDFQLKIPRQEVQHIIHVVRQAARSLYGQEVSVIGAGSYRRGKVECGDVDILITRLVSFETLIIILDDDIHKVSSRDCVEWISIWSPPDWKELLSKGLYIFAFLMHKFFVLVSMLTYSLILCLFTVWCYAIEWSGANRCRIETEQLHYTWFNRTRNESAESKMKRLIRFACLHGAEEM